MNVPIVGLLVVSHSPNLAQGVVELAIQMAPNVPIRGTGGNPDGTLGTSFDAALVELEALLAELPTESVVVACGDLGSARMVVETIAEQCSAPERVHVANGPLVEGVVAGAVTAGQGATALIVATAIEQAAHQYDPEPELIEEFDLEELLEEDEAATIVVGDPDGLHARPAALLARLASDFDAKVLVNGVDATSVLSLMSLGVREGDEVSIRVDGPDAQAALAAIRGLLERADTPEMVSEE